MLSAEGLAGCSSSPDSRRFPMKKTVEAEGRDEGLIGGITKLGATDCELPLRVLVASFMAWEAAQSAEGRGRLRVRDASRRRRRDLSRQNSG